jgi:hypothetical protein
MRAIFHHAYFVPWLGYFSKLEVADALVVLDAAKFRRNHIKRVSIIGTHGGPEWFTLPVGNNWSVPCNEIVLPAGPDYVTKLLRTLKLSYGRAAAFKEEFADFEILFSRTYFPGRDIVAANIQAITELRRRWTSSTTTILIASQYSQAADRDQRMIEICWHLGSRPGSYKACGHQGAALPLQAVAPDIYTGPARATREAFRVRALGR